MFDVVPEDISAPSSITTFLAMSTAIKDAGLPQNTNMGSIYTNETGLFTVATDPKFTARLEMALEKNFEYVIRYSKFLISNNFVGIFE